MLENDEITIPSPEGDAWIFESSKMLWEWLRSESDHWEGLLAQSSTSSSDPVGAIGEHGAKEHSEEYVRFLAELGALISGNFDENAQSQAIARVSQTIAERIMSRDLVVSTTRLGQSISQLSKIDLPAANLMISLASGRNISRVISPQNAKILWRGIPRVVSGAALNIAGNLSDAVEALSEIKMRSAQVSAVESEIRDVFDKTKIDINEQLNRRESELQESIQSINKEGLSAIDEVKRQWEVLRATYEAKFALRAPVDYWGRRKSAHLVGSILWGAVALIFVGIAAGILVPAAAEKLSSIRDLMFAKSGASISWISYLPEIFQIAVVAFLSLWALRFFVRQVSEHLARREEAAQRVTMAETFLALSNPGEGRESLVGEADRAVIVQALFRPSGINGIDDAPPAHWIEDVFRRIKSNDKAS